MKQFLIIGLLLMPILLSGCIIYGHGKTYGYIDSIEEGIIWNKVYIKPSLESSQEDCFIFSKDSNLATQFESFAQYKTRLVLNYDRHLFTIASGCEYGNDEIVSLEVIGDTIQ